MIEVPSAPDPREELAELASAVRAYVEWQADTGAAGFPVEPHADPADPAAAPLGDGHKVPVPPTAPTFAAPPWSMAPARSIEAAPSPAVSMAEPVATGRAQAPPPQPPLTPVVGQGADERRTRLALLAEEVRACTRCALHEKRQQTVFSRGDPFAELVFVGEGPGADEDAQGEPFVGPAGQLLDKMVAAMGYRRDQVYIANIVKCRPPSNRKPEPEEMASCMPFLSQQLGFVKPRVLVALGATAVQGLCGTTEGITRLRGKWKLYKGSIPIMPTFHPAYLLRNPAAKREVWSDLQDVMKHLGKPVGRA